MAFTFLFLDFLKSVLILAERLDSFSNSLMNVTRIVTTRKTRKTMSIENSEVNSLIPQETWIDVRTLANLKGVTERSIRLNISQYTSRRKENGSYEILLSSIEQEIQERYKNEQYKKLLFDELGETIEPIRLEQDQLIPEESKRIALARLDLLNLWNDFRNQYPQVTKGNKDFLTLYNTGQLHKNLYDILGHVAIGTIYRWKLAIGNPQSGDWTKLAPAYKYTSYKTTRITLTDEEITLFLKILLHPNKFKVGKAINLTRYILHRRGYQAIPKYATFKRYADWFKKHNYDKWVLAREGEKAKTQTKRSFVSCCVKSVCKLLGCLFLNS